MSTKELTEDQRAALEVLAGPLQSLAKEIETLIATESDEGVSLAKLRALFVALQQPFEQAAAATTGRVTAGLELELEAAKRRITELEKLERHLKEIKDSAAKSEEAWSSGIRDFTAGADLLMGRVVTTHLGRSVPHGWQPARHAGGGAGGEGSEAWRCSFGGGGASEAWRCPFGGGGASEAWRCSFGGGGASEAWRCSFGGGGASEAWRCPFGGGGASEAWRCPFGGGGGSEPWRCPDGDG